MIEKKIKIGLMGSQGKMGVAIRQLLHQNTDVVPFVEITSRPTEEFILSYQSVFEASIETLKSVDVWIDFSRPEGLEDLLEAIDVTKSALVSGTTGLTEAQYLKLKNFSKKHTVFWASNMSIGLWTIRQALKSLKSIAHFDFVIDEIHHTQKKDNPSGTAITLQSDLEKVIGKKIATPTGYRIGGIFGIHTVTAASQSEMIKIEHSALNRAVFAEGAVKAALWVVKKKSGFYSMDDLMGNQKTQSRSYVKRKKATQRQSAQRRK